MKKETFYAPFACSFTDLLHGAPVHEGRDGMVIANEADRDFNAYSNGAIKQTQDIDTPEHEEEEIH